MNHLATRWHNRRIVSIVLTVIASAALTVGAMGGRSVIAAPAQVRSATAQSVSLRLQDVGHDTRAPRHAVSRMTQQHMAGHLPLAFEINRGQAASQVRFLAHGNGFTVFLTGGDAVLKLDRVQRTTPTDHLNGTPAADARETVVRLHFLHANRHPQSIGLDRLPGVANYFIGNNPRNWHAGVHTFARVEERNVYPGVDVIYYGHQGHLEYDMVVHPGADVQRIQERVLGAGRPHLDRRGNLLYSGSGISVGEEPPHLYQVSGINRHPVAGRFLVGADASIAFRAASYDRSRVLVIDPTLTFSTFVGGSGTDGGRGISVDSGGDMFITGTTASSDFPTATFPGPPDPYQATNAGGYDVYVSEISPSGNVMDWSTYVGGSSTDIGTGIDAYGGNEYVTGYTQSTNFPTRLALNGSNSGGGDGFVAGISGDGSSLLFSTYIGGAGDDYAYGISAGIGCSASCSDISVVGSTTSTNLANVPNLGYAGGNDAFMESIYYSPSSSPVLDKGYTADFGGSGDDFASAVWVDGSGNIYLTGSTTSTNFPICPGNSECENDSFNSMQSTNAGGQDAFVVEIDLRDDGSGSYSKLLRISTYLGGSGNDSGGGIIGYLDMAFITGSTTSTNFPVSALAFQPHNAGGEDAFVAWVESGPSAQSPDVRLDYSSYLGGSGLDTGRGITIDGNDNVYVGGDSTSTDFPTAAPLQATSGGGDDAFVTEMNVDTGALPFSTYFGGSGQDEATALCMDDSGGVYLTGQTSSNNFPISTILQSGYGGATDAFVFKLQSSTPTLSRIERFSAHRTGGLLTLAWRTTGARNVIGFNLRAGNHRLNVHTIPVHTGANYRYQMRWSGGGPYALVLLLGNGRRVSVPASHAAHG